MKVGIIISTDEVETCWNALRFANFCVKQGDEAKVFLMGRGVEYQRASNEKFDTVSQAESELCPISTMKDMYDIVKESDRVVTF